MDAVDLDASLTPDLLPRAPDTPNDGIVMDTSTVLGSVLLATGMLTLLVAVVRAMGRDFAFGVYELWVLPVLGLSLLVLGTSLVR